MLVVLVAAILGVVGLLMLYHARWTSSSSTETHVMLRGDRSELLADTAIQEAMARVQKSANDGRSGPFALFRRNVLAPELGEFDLSPSLTFPAANTVLDKLPNQGFHLAPPSVQVVVQEHLDDIVSYERQGFVRYRQQAGTSGRLPYRSVEREVEVVQSFKTVLLNPPHPFCHFGCFVNDVSTMTDTSAINPNRASLQSSLRHLRSGLERLRSYAGGLAGEYDALLAEAYDVGFAERHAAPVPGCHSRRGSCYGLVLTAEPASYDLHWLNLAQRLYEHVEAVRTEFATYEPPSMGLALALHRGDAGAHRRVLTSARRVWTILKEALDKVHDFNRTFTILPAVTPDGRPNDAYVRLQRSQGKFGRVYWDVRATYVVGPSNGDGSLQERWASFLATHPRPRGVVVVRDGASRLGLSGTVDGQLVVVAGSAGAYLEDFGFDAPPSTELTVVVPDGTVTISGRCRCAVLVGRRAKLEMLPGAELKGALIMAGTAGDDSLGGTIEADPTYFFDMHSVDTDDAERDARSLNKLFVSFSPRIRYRKVRRR